LRSFFTQLLDERKLKAFDIGIPADSGRLAKSERSQRFVEFVQPVVIE
jgi:hypothetical protein